MGQAAAEKKAAADQAARDAIEQAEWDAWEAEEKKSAMEKAARESAEAGEAAAAKEKVQKPPPKVAVKKPTPKQNVEIESKWGVPAAGMEQGEGEDGERDDDVGPSLADSLSGPNPPKKSPPPQPKKKEKKKWGKLYATAIGFDANNPNMYG